MLAATLDTEAGLNLLKKNCLSRVFTKHAVSMKVTRLRSAANTKQKENRVTRQRVQLDQRTAKTVFLIVTDLATDMILRIAYINENIDMISPKKGILKPTGPSSVAIEESVGSTAYMADILETKQGHPKDVFNKYHCTAVCQSTIRSMSEAYLYATTNDRGVRLDTSYKYLVKNYQAFVAQGIVEIVPTQSFIVKMANWSSQQM